MNIVSLITCKVTGLSYVGVTKAGRLDDPSDFSPLRYGFGSRFVEAVRRYGPFEFTIQILGHGYANRAELYSAQRKFIEEYNTLWPHGYNVIKGRQSHSELPSAAITAQRLARDPQWRAANAAAAAKRAQSTGWRLALNKRAQNATWRRLESIARLPILHARWHVKPGLVPEGTTVENCGLCKAIVQRKERRENWREQTDATTSYLHTRWHVKTGKVSEGTTVGNCDLCKTVSRHKELRRKYHGKQLPDLSENLPSHTLQEELDDVVQCVNAMFKRA